MSTTEKHPLRIAMENRDRRGIRAALADDVELNSPITSYFRFEGADEVTELLDVILETLDDFVYTAEFGTETERLLMWRGNIGRQVLEASDYMTLAPDGRITSFTIFIRPLPGLTRLLSTLGPNLARRRGRLRAITLAMMTRPLAAITRVADPVGPLLVGKRRSARAT